MSDSFYDIKPDSYSLWTKAEDYSGCGVLTAEILEEAYERARKDFGREPIEYHSPHCPKILTNAKKACRCGGSPWEAPLEDWLDGKEARSPWDAKR